MTIDEVIEDLRKNHSDEEIFDFFKAYIDLMAEAVKDFKSSGLSWEEWRARRL